MQSQLTITAKGQVTLRKTVLEHLGLKPGHKVDVALLPDGRVELRAASAGADISACRASLQRKQARPVSLDEMQGAIEAGPMA